MHYAGGRLTIDARLDSGGSSPSEAEKELFDVVLAAILEVDARHEPRVEVTGLEGVVGRDAGQVVPPPPRVDSWTWPKDRPVPQAFNDDYDEMTISGAMTDYERTLQGMGQQVPSRQELIERIKAGRLQPSEVEPVVLPPWPASNGVGMLADMIAPRLAAEIEDDERPNGAGGVGWQCVFPGCPFAFTTKASRSRHWAAEHGAATVEGEGESRDGALGAGSVDPSVPPSRPEPSSAVDDAVAAMQALSEGVVLPQGYPCSECPRVLATEAGRSRHLTVAHKRHAKRVEAQSAAVAEVAAAGEAMEQVVDGLVTCGVDGCEAKRSPDAIGRHRLSMHGV